jgi:hypothetical protein
MGGGSMEEKQTAPCIICGQRHEHGIRIMSVFLCDGCESVIVETDAEDVKYPYFVHKMKQVLVRKIPTALNGSF